MGWPIEQEAGESSCEVRKHRLPSDITVMWRPVDQDQRRPISEYAPCNLRAVRGYGSVDPLIGHGRPSCPIASLHQPYLHNVWDLGLNRARTRRLTGSGVRLDLVGPEKR